MAKEKKQPKLDEIEEADDDEIIEEINEEIDEQDENDEQEEVDDDGDDEQEENETKTNVSITCSFRVPKNEHDDFIDLIEVLGMTKQAFLYSAFQEHMNNQVEIVEQRISELNKLKTYLKKKEE